MAWADPVQRTVRVNPEEPLGYGWKLSDLTALSLARRFRVCNLPLEDTDAIMQNLRALVAQILVPCERIFHGKFRVVAGYLSPASHSLLGWKPTTHLYGRAVDLAVYDYSGLDVVRTLAQNRVEFDTAVLGEYHKSLHDRMWVHLTIPERGQSHRNRLMVYDKELRLHRPWRQDDGEM